MIYDSSLHILSCTINGQYRALMYFKCFRRHWQCKRQYAGK